MIQEPLGDKSVCVHQWGCPGAHTYCLKCGAFPAEVEPAFRPPMSVSEWITETEQRLLKGRWYPGQTDALLRLDQAVAIIRAQQVELDRLRGEQRSEEHAPGYGHGM